MLEQNYIDNMAPDSQRQMPVFSQVGKGLPGDSAIVAINLDGAESTLRGFKQDGATGELSTQWILPLATLVPKLHYEVWRGVRTIDEVKHWGYYIKFSCSITIDNDSLTFWEFETPFAITSKFLGGGTVPADYKIDEQ